MRRLLLVLALPLLLNGCILAAVGAGTEVGVTASENRSTGRKVDDTALYTHITDKFVEEDQAKLITDVTFNIRYGRVMLTGTTTSESDAQKAVAITWKVKGVEEVINELVVDPNAGFFSTANDSLIKRNLEARLLITKGVWVINYSIDVQDGTAYLIGRVKDQAELNRVMNVAKSTKGVKRVISHLQINPDVDAPNSTAPATDNNTAVTPVSSAPLDSPAPIPPASNGPVSQDSTRPMTVAAPDSISSSPVAPPAGH